MINPADKWGLLVQILLEVHIPSWNLNHTVVYSDASADQVYDRDGYFPTQEVYLECAESRNICKNWINNYLYST